jgi:hypothetical protein
MTRRSLIILLLLGTLCARATFARPQAGSAPAIRVESNEVLVPTIVDTREHGDPVLGLTVSDFRLFEDGQEQKIQKVEVERAFCRDFRNNFGVHETEWALTPGQEWSILGGGGWGTAYARDVYLLAYVPPHSVEGSCHEVKIQVDRRNVTVTARSEYCNTAHSPSDPLAGTTFSKQMEADAASANAGKTPLSVQADFFYAAAKPARVYITVEFPSDAIKYHANPDGLRFEVGVLAMAYRRDGALAARSSDLIEDNVPLDDNLRNMPVFDALNKTLIPNHHEAQMELPPGDYDLRVVVSDGSKFGRAQLPLTVDSYDGKQLAISSIALCKQFHDLSKTLPDPGYEATLSGFVPLVSKGLKFTPAGDTSFRKNDSLFAYYEVYEPLLAGMPGTAVQTRLRVINTETGEVKGDSGSLGVASWMQTGNAVIPISQKVAIDKLTKGSYRMEVQATDSAGRSTVWRAASFTIK